jgi:hypothetical protein
MYLAYLDESGSPYKDYRTYWEGYGQHRQSHPDTPLPYPFFVLAGVGIRESHLPVVDEWFSNAKRSFLGSGDSVAMREYEIKGSILYALREGREPTNWTGKGRKGRTTDAAKTVWRSLTARQLERLEGSIFDLLPRLAPVIWVVVVKQHDAFARYGDDAWPPYYHALTYLQQRVAHYVQASHGAYQRAMFLMDETAGLSTPEQFDSYISVRDRINQTAAWPVDFGRYMVEAPTFGSSHLHQALQIADVVSHAVWKHVRGQDRFGWFGRLEPFLASHPRGGDYNGVGLTFIPKAKRPPRRVVSV